MKFTTDFSDDDAFAFVHEWLHALAEGGYKRALEFTEHDPYYKWTPRLLRETIECYGFPESNQTNPYRITLPAEATGKCVRSIERREPAAPNVVARLVHSIPLNGEWSDLQVAFRFEHRSGEVASVLEEIHVF